MWCYWLQRQRSPSAKECGWSSEAQKNPWPKASKETRPRSTELNLSNTMNELASAFSPQSLQIKAQVSWHLAFSIRRPEAEYLARIYDLWKTMR